MNSQSAKVEFYQKLLLITAFEQMKNDMNIISNDISDVLQEKTVTAELSENNSDLTDDEKIDEDQIFFNQKRARIKRKIEEEASKNNKIKDKTLMKSDGRKNNDKNYIEKNANIVIIKDKPQTKRLNGMTVRINKKSGTEKQKKDKKNDCF